MRLFFMPLLLAALLASPLPAKAQLLEDTMACTRELKICPDGTSVARTGPNCAFAPCPGETTGSVPGAVPGSAPSGAPGYGGGAMPEPMPPAKLAPPPSVEPHDRPGRMCTMDAKICPDGTGVGRTGPNCEFAPCPGEEGYDPPEEPEYEPEYDAEEEQGFVY